MKKHKTYINKFMNGYVSAQLPNFVPLSPLRSIIGELSKSWPACRKRCPSTRANLARLRTVFHVPVNWGLQSYPANEDPKKNRVGRPEWSNGMDQVH